MDYVITLSAAVIVAALVILASSLLRYSELVKQADTSARLAKDVWDSANSRFSVVDARIIDLMAKTEVISSRISGLSSPAEVKSRSAQAGGKEGEKSTAQLARVSTEAGSAETTDTEVKVLRFLVDGPKSSARIKEEVGKSREHTARLMKALFDRGLVARNERTKPYVYEITESGRSYVAK